MVVVLLLGFCGDHHERAVQYEHSSVTALIPVALMIATHELTKLDLSAELILESETYEKLP